MSQESVPKSEMLSTEQENNVRTSAATTILPSHELVMKYKVGSSDQDEILSIKEDTLEGVHKHHTHPREKLRRLTNQVQENTDTISQEINERVVQNELDPSEYVRIGKEVIQMVDFRVLEELLIEIRRKSGVEVGKFFVGKEKIGISKAPDNTVHGIFSNVMGAWIQIQVGFWEMQEQKTVSTLRNNVLSALIHEETHASSKNVPFHRSFGNTVKSVLSSLRSPNILKSGYYAGSVFEGSKFLFFNEGVTDKIAEDVYQEYLKRTGDREYYGQGEHPEYAAGERYLGARAMVTSMVEIIAQSIDVPSDKIWETFIQGYMTGIDLDDTELKQALDEIIFFNFTFKIKNHGESEESLPLAEIQKKVKETEFSDDARKRIALAFQKYESLAEKRKIKISKQT